MQKIIIAIAMIAISPLAWSQGAFRYGPYKREGEWNIALEAVHQGSESSSSGRGTGLSIKDDWGFGFMVNYNFTNHLALGFDMSFLLTFLNPTIIMPRTINQSRHIKVLLGHVWIKWPNSELEVPTRSCVQSLDRVIKSF